MTAYGEVAAAAARLAANGIHAPPDAWRIACEQRFPNSPSQRSKGCPKGAFLGLCSAGLVRGVPAGSYTHSRLNADYAVNGVEALRSNPSLASSAQRLWRHMSLAPNKAHNSQADVVIALFESGLLAT